MAIPLVSGEALPQLEAPLAAASPFFNLTLCSLSLCSAPSSHHVCVPYTFDHLRKPQNLQDSCSLFKMSTS